MVLAKEKYNLRGRDLGGIHAEFVPFTAQTRMSGVNLPGMRIRKGSADAIARFLEDQGSSLPKKVRDAVEEIARAGGTPLVVAENSTALGVIYLKDIVKGGLKERLARLRAMGIRTIMITGDNPLTAAVIAREAGVDDFLAEAKPKDKMDLIKREQGKGKLVAMTGDGTNDAPALAQADVGVAMNSGTQAAKEAGNMVDLDSNPTKLIEIVEIGKQLLMTRGALTTFSIANDVAKYFAIIPAMFSVAFPVLNALNIMHLHSPQSAILSAVIFNAIIIVALIPLALKGVKYEPKAAEALAAAQPAHLRCRRRHRSVHRHQGHRHAARSHAPGIEEIEQCTRQLHSLQTQQVTLRPVTHSVWSTSIRFTLLTTLLFGIGYPLLVTGIAGVMFPHKAAGSLILKNGQVIGSELLAQSFTSDRYFHPASIGCRQWIRPNVLGRIESCTVERQACAAHPG